MRFPLLCMTLTVAFGCSDGPNVIEIQPATVAGLAYVDTDADGVLTAGVDVPAPGVTALLVLAATDDTVTRATTRADGTFIMPLVPLGAYRLLASRGTLGDSLEVQHLDPTPIQLAAGDTAVRVIGLGYARYTAAAARNVPTGRRITVEGIALNAWSAFGDSTIHVQDATGALRAIRVRSTNVQAGDSVRIVGTLGIEEGRIVLVDGLARVIAGARGLPALDSMSAARAATADAGRRADSQVRIAGAIVRDTVTIGAYRRVGVDDGTGRLELLLNRNIAFSPQAYTPGAQLDASGILVRSGTSWQLKPRQPADVVASFPTASAAQVRTLATGTRVFVHGIALNGWATFADSTLHIADASGAIRAIRVRPSAVVAGDSVRVLGLIGRAADQVALVDADVSIVALARGLPPLDSVSTADAAAARTARADGQVRIAGAVIRDTAVIAGDLVLGVDDGSGRLEIVLDRNIAFPANTYVPGATLRASGVLVPAPAGTGWQLKPRDRNEAVVSFPTVSVLEARTLEVGRRVLLEGVALNSSATFGDSTVHLLDRTGALRAVRVLNVVAAGDSVRLLGAIATRSGQPVLSNVTVTLVRAGVGVPEPDSISTAKADVADGGRLDAMQVRVGGSIVGSESLPTGDLIIRLDDGSGVLEVMFDRDVSFAAGPYVPGALLRVSGLLVATGTGRWQLKPRGPQDALATYPTVTVAQARALAVGRTVYVQAIALNSWVTFGDSTVHVRDATGSLRVVRLPPSPVFAGDSVRILGTVAVRSGQPVFNGITASVLFAGAGLPAPDSVSTAVAATAQNGTRDAAQVAVSGTISAIDSTGVDWIVTVSDGSGALRVVLDRDIGFALGAFRPGVQLRVRGVLVPAASGTEWFLKPRGLQEIVIVGS